MATVSGEEIFARARTIATQTRSDAHSSPVIDAKGGARALLNHVIRQVYRTKSNDQRFIRDIFATNTVAVTSGVGACPDTVMREFLHLGEFTDDNQSLITYYNYLTDWANDQNYATLGYVVLVGDSFQYREPSGTATSYTGDLNVYVPSFPTLPASMASNITFPSDTTIDDVVLSLGAALIGALEWSEGMANPK